MQEKFLNELDEGALLALPYLFEFWAMDHQLPPEGDWRSWVIMGGRGAGKTRAGAEWVRSQVEGNLPLDPGRARRVALVGETIEQVREVMIFGESGILACSPPDRRPEWRATRKMLEWPNGATAQIFSASEPEGLRGPQFDAAWVDEIGCAAIDKGTNQPNKFLDVKSSESGLPKYSDGRRDDLMQMQYLRAMFEFWGDGANNPVSSVYGAPMVDMSRSHVWAWDVRPFPFFPHISERWSDAENYFRGHWLNGRTTARALADTVAEICARSGVDDIDVSALYGYLRGYVVSDVDGARAALQPLMLAFGFEAVEREGRLIFSNRTGLADVSVGPDTLAWLEEQDSPVEKIRVPEAETVGRVRLNFLDADGDYDVRTEEAVFPDETSELVSQTEFALLLTRNEARATSERWLSESRVARDSVRFSLPLSEIETGAGDVVSWDDGDETALYRIDRVTQSNAQLIEAVRVEPEIYQASDGADLASEPRPFSAPIPVYSLFMDLPLLRGDEVEHEPHIAVTAEPWPGSVAVYSSASDSGYVLNKLIAAQSIIGETQTTLAPGAHGVLDRGPALRVKLGSGVLSSATLEDVLNGANIAAIGDGTGANWEVFQFTDAVLVSEDVYDISGRIRGQAGTDALPISTWPVGSQFVMLDGTQVQLDVALAARGLARHYRIGPANRTYDDPSFGHAVEAFEGIGLRPLAPVHLRAPLDGAGTRAVSWVRRTRIDGDSWQSVEVPLGEDSESYLVRVVHNGSVIREVTTATPTWDYTAVMRSSDGISGTYSIDIAQISARFGAGLFRRIDLDD